MTDKQNEFSRYIPPYGTYIGEAHVIETTANGDTEPSYLVSVEKVQQKFRYNPDTHQYERVELVFPLVEAALAKARQEGFNEFREYATSLVLNKVEQLRAGRFDGIQAEDIVHDLFMEIHEVFSKADYEVLAKSNERLEYIRQGEEQAIINFSNQLARKFPNHEKEIIDERLKYQERSELWS